MGAQASGGREQEMAVNLELIFRDVYSLHGNREKVRRAVAIARKCVQLHR